MLMDLRRHSSTGRMVVVMSVPRIFAADLELRRLYARTLYALGPHRIAIDGQAAQRRPNLLQRHACVDQGADNHVARCAREAVEVEDPHDWSILLDTTGEPSGFDHRVVALLTENQVIEDVDAHDVAGINHALRQGEIIGARRRIA